MPALLFCCDADDALQLHSFPTRRSSDLGAHRTGAEAPLRARLPAAEGGGAAAGGGAAGRGPASRDEGAQQAIRGDRKSTRLNSSHSQISYAVFCLEKKLTVPLDRLLIVL